MKTIKSGQLKSTTAWWHGKTVTCKTCSFAGKLESGDKVTTIASRLPEGTREVSIPCPTAGCHGTAKFVEKLPKAKSD